MTTSVTMDRVVPKVKCKYLIAASFAHVQVGLQQQILKIRTNYNSHVGVTLLKHMTRQQLLATLNKHMIRGNERRSLHSASKQSL